MTSLYDLIQTALLLILVYTFFAWLNHASLPAPVPGSEEILGRRVDLWSPPDHDHYLLKVLNKATTISKANTPENLQEMFPFERFSNVDFSERSRKQLYQDFREERKKVTAGYNEINFEARVFTLAKSCNARYHKIIREPGNTPHQKIFNLLHLLQDILDIRMNFFLHLQDLNSVPFSETRKQFPGFERDFDATIVSELNLSRTTHSFSIAFDQCIVLTIIKTIDVGLAADDFLIENEDVLKHYPNGMPRE